ncbi:MAG: hypothetical protein HOE90_00210 [Bacteriovoracaceae bacterium]|jgi:hypothetical protein|nr:hypothetical protein [Bacteriovoracaceae bacterium]
MKIAILGLLTLLMLPLGSWAGEIGQVTYLNIKSKPYLFGDHQFPETKDLKDVNLPFNLRVRLLKDDEPSSHIYIVSLTAEENDGVSKANISANLYFEEEDGALTKIYTFKNKSKELKPDGVTKFRYQRSGYTVDGDFSMNLKFKVKI